MIHETPNGISLEVKIIPNASKNEIVGWENDKLKIRIQKPAEKNKANKELVVFLAKIFKVAKSNVQIISGEKSSHKRIAIDGILLSTALEILSLYL
jgi:uncharacterized protein